MRAELEHEYVEYVRARMLALRTLAYRLCGDWHRADDLVQATLVRLYRHWPKASAAALPDAYVRKILVHECLAERQRWWARRVEPVAEPAVAPAGPGDGSEHRLDLMAALSRLARGQRAVLVLRYWQGLSV